MQGHCFLGGLEEIFGSHFLGLDTCLKSKLLSVSEKNHTSYLTDWKWITCSQFLGKEAWLWIKSRKELSINPQLEICQANIVLTYHQILIYYSLLNKKELGLSHKPAKLIWMWDVKQQEVKGRYTPAGSWLLHFLNESEKIKLHWWNLTWLHAI